MGTHTSISRVQSSLRLTLTLHACLFRVPTQVLQSLIKSYNCFSIYKALQSLIFWYFRPNRSYKVLYFYRKGDFRLTDYQEMNTARKLIFTYIYKSLKYVVNIGKAPPLMFVAYLNICT